jgi:hypothetical protein
MIVKSKNYISTQYMVYSLLFNDSYCVILCLNGIKKLS